MDTPAALIIFDCDGVLVDSERIVNAIESRELRRLGIELSPDEVRRRFKGKTIDEDNAEIERIAGTRVPASWTYDYAMASALGFVRELRAVDGVEGVIARVQAAGVASCVASQSPPARVALSLVVTNLDRYFGERVYTASVVARPKPAPDLFLYAAAALGVAPERSVVIEDSPSGVRAAVAAGMDVYGYAADEDAHALAAAGARVFTAMAELPALLGV
ncbi:MAG TPA: HAD-IA family hydrolase [Candidatus Sulfotelmatobacter sp.]|nr:HAD-IA family hydrolase [Candidatus Sulfotelmatobacter sp.]